MKGLFIGLFCHILKQFLNNPLKKSIPAVPKRLCSYFWDTSKLKQRSQYLWYQLLIHVPTLISFSTNRREVTATPSITEENQLYYQQWLSCSQSRCLPWGLAQSYIHCDINFGLFLRKKKSLQVPTHQLTNLYMELMPDPPTRALQTHWQLH